MEEGKREKGEERQVEEEEEEECEEEGKERRQMGGRRGQQIKGMRSLTKRWRLWEVERRRSKGTRRMDRWWN